MALRVLVTYSMQSASAQTIIDYLDALRLHTEFDVSYAHVTHDAILDFDLDAYDVVFQNYCVRLCFEGYASTDYIGKLAAFRGLKIISVQDDYDRTNHLHDEILKIGFHAIITTIPPDVALFAYPRDKLPGIEVCFAQTGYVTNERIEQPRSYRPLSDRKILLAYRGRDIGGRYGRMGFEKYEIGRRAKELCAAAGVPHDIAMDEASRIYGEAWFDFIGNARAMLASESGSNIWDFDGGIEHRFKAMGRTLGRNPTYREFAPYVVGHEARPSMGQIAPRHFECALMRTPLVMFPGRYSELLNADEHYIPLAKDFSNFDKVIARLSDIPALEAMAERTYDRLVASGEFTYRAFAAWLQALIVRKHAELREGRLAVRPPAIVPNKNHSPKIHSPAVTETLRARPTDQPQRQLDFDIHYERYLIALYSGEVSRLDAALARFGSAGQIDASAPPLTGADLKSEDGKQLYAALKQRREAITAYIALQNATISRLRGEKPPAPSVAQAAEEEIPRILALTPRYLARLAPLEAEHAQLREALAHQAPDADPAAYPSFAERAAGTVANFAARQPATRHQRIMLTPTFEIEYEARQTRLLQMRIRLDIARHRRDSAEQDELAMLEATMADWPPPADATPMDRLAAEQGFAEALLQIDNRLRSAEGAPPFSAAPVPRYIAWRERLSPAVLLECLLIRHPAWQDDAARLRVLMQQLRAAAPSPIAMARVLARNSSRVATLAQHMRAIQARFSRNGRSPQP